MMGKKKLSKIRAEINEAFASVGQKAAWFDEQVRKLEQGQMSSECEKETLLLLRDALASADRTAPRRSTGKSRQRSSTQL